MEFLKVQNKTAIIYDEKSISYSEVLKKVKSFSKKLNIENGDRVIIFMENRPEFIYSFFSVWDKKGINVCLDAGLNSEELQYYLKDSGPKYIFTSEKNVLVTKEAIKKIESEKEITVIVVEDILEEYEAEDLVVNMGVREEIAVILYTSGTTGAPKGVMLTFENIIANINGLDKYKMYKESDIVLALLPLHHVFALIGTAVVPLYKGATIVFLKELSAKAMMEAFKKYNISFMLGVPRLWESIHSKIMERINSSKVTASIFKVMEKIGSKKLSKIVFKKIHKSFGENLRFFISGGSKLDPQISKDFLNLGIEVCEGYGLTETSPLISFTPMNQIVPGSAGKIIDGVQYKILEDGELLVKGANVMKGYYNKPLETQEVIDSEGWFHTGDLAEIKDEYLFITGRKKEMIVLSNGKKINPNDMEIELMKSSELIKEVAVMEYNNHLTAVVFVDLEKAKEKKIVNIKESLKWDVIDKYNVKAPNYKKILETILVTEELPKTRLGKIQRFKLLDFLKKQDKVNSPEKTEKEIVEPTHKEYIELKSYLIKNHPEVKITPDSHIEMDIGMDSLDNVEMIAYIESAFGIKITEEELAQAKTVKEIAELIKIKGGQFKEIDMNWKKLFETHHDYPIPKSNWAGSILDILIFKPVFSMYFNLKISGKEKIQKEPTIFIGNHQSMLDGFAFSQLLSKKMKKNSYYLGTSTHFASKFRKWLANNSNLIIIDYDKNIKESLQIIAQVLKSGKNVIIFPEGARTRDGKIQDFKKSFAILASELKIPVTIFGIKGAYDLMPPGKSFPKRGKLEVAILDTIYPEDLTVEEIVNLSKSKIEEFLK
ncbi:MAG: AMP-binding protein [Fusobacteriaceae bacterium]